LGYLYADTDINKAIGHYQQASTLTKSKAEKQTLLKQIELLRLKLQLSLNVNLCAL